MINKVDTNTTLSRSIQALIDFRTARTAQNTEDKKAQQVFLRVVTEGSIQYLTLVEVSPLDRVWMWLGLGATSMRSVARFIVNNKDFFKNGKNEHQPLELQEALTFFKEKIEIYTNNHWFCSTLKKASEIFDTLIKTFSTPIKEDSSQATSTPVKDLETNPDEEGMNPADRPEATSTPVKGSQTDPDEEGMTPDVKMLAQGASYLSGTIQGAAKGLANQIRNISFPRFLSPNEQTENSSFHLETSSTPNQPAQE